MVRGSPRKVHLHVPCLIYTLTPLTRRVVFHTGHMGIDGHLHRLGTRRRRCILCTVYILQIHPPQTSKNFLVMDRGVAWRGVAWRGFNVLTRASAAGGTSACRMCVAGGVLPERGGDWAFFPAQISAASVVVRGIRLRGDDFATHVFLSKEGPNDHLFLGDAARGQPPTHVVVGHHVRAVHRSRGRAAW